MDKISKIMNETLQGVTGILISDRKDFILSISHLFQKQRGADFLQKLINEWTKYVKKGRIKEDYINSEQLKDCLMELLLFIDNDSPDEIRFNAMKKIFFCISTEKISDRNDPLPYQIMKICRTLTSGEILVLNAAYQIWKEGNSDQIFKEARSSAKDWLQAIAEKSNLKYPELVSIHEDDLIKKNIITDRTYSDRRGVMIENFRLTELGIKICDFIENYEELHND